MIIFMAILAALVITKVAKETRKMNVKIAKIQNRTNRKHK